MFVIWFLFDKSDHEYLSSIIQKLSNQYNCHSFIPHITAHGIINTNIEQIDKIITDSIKGIKSFFIEKNKLTFTDNFWKTLFIDISPNQKMVEINKKLRNDLPLKQDYDFSPHISLMYKKINEKEKEKLEATIITKNNFKISKLGILKFSENINEWKIIQEYSLNG